jgi:thymidylate synthase (FAD)
MNLQFENGIKKNIQEENIQETVSQVKLISFTKNADDNKNLEEIIVYCARVSNPANQCTKMNNDKLIKYLISNEHWSPFEMISICLEINTTRDISRQILRHRSFSFQEFSQRYAKAELGFELREARLQDNKNRQNSIETNDQELNTKWLQLQNEVKQASLNAYEWAITNGIAKEQARVVLPEGNTMTRLYMNGTLRSWIHYIQLRSGNGTQKEHKKIAIDCANAIKPIFPLIMDFISV